MSEFYDYRKPSCRRKQFETLYTMCGSKNRCKNGWLVSIERRRYFRKRKLRRTLRCTARNDLAVRTAHSTLFKENDYALIPAIVALNNVMRFLSNFYFYPSHLFQETMWHIQFHVTYFSQDCFLYIFSLDGCCSRKFISSSLISSLFQM